MANYQTITSDKNKDTALIMCILGGWFGLHQYYVGNIKKGLLYIYFWDMYGRMAYRYNKDTVRKFQRQCRSTIKSHQKTKQLRYILNILDNINVIENIIQEYSKIQVII